MLNHVKEIWHQPSKDSDYIESNNNHQKVFFLVLLWGNKIQRNWAYNINFEGIE